MYVLSIDVGTSSVRASLFDAQGRQVPGASAGMEHQPITTPDGGAEMDAEDLFQRTLDCVDGALRSAGGLEGPIVAVGLCTFWHSFLGVGGDGRPTTPIVLWADTRSVDQVEHLKNRVDVEAVHRRTGTVQHTSYWPPRILWIAENRDEWLRATKRWMSPGEYFHLRLFGEASVGVCMASGTGLYNHQTSDWDEDVLGALQIECEQLSRIVDTSAGVRGLLPEFTARFPALKDALWLPAAGDGACSNVGSGCVTPERLALMVGTSGALRVMRSQADGPELDPPAGLWKYRLDRNRYLLGGALSNGGNLFAWLRGTLQLPDAAEAEAALAKGEPDSHGLTVLPFLAGERCPGWRGEARAAFVGVSWSTTPLDLLRAGLEAVAYRFALIHDRLDDAAAPDHRLIASGGALLSSPAWTQLLADALGRELVACEESEATSRGAALLALEAAGVIPDLGAVPTQLGRTFQPSPERTRVYSDARGRQKALYEALIATNWQHPST